MSIGGLAHIRKKPSPSPDVCCDEYPNCEHYVEYSAASPEKDVEAYMNHMTETTKKAIRNAEKPASDDDRLYTTIKLRTWKSPPQSIEDEPEDVFLIAAWATRRQIEALKEFFLTSVMLDHIETDKKHKEAVE